MFNGPADVSETQIFVSPVIDPIVVKKEYIDIDINEDNKHNATKIKATEQRQLTVYSNIVASKNDNVMILPVPNPKSVEFINLEEYPKIFDDLEKSFKKPNFTNSVTRGFYLKVEKVGSYDATLVENFEELDFLDTSIFPVINNEFRIILKKYYTNFGFIVCKINPSRGHKFHPFAYTHNVIKTGYLFVPTRHQHGYIEEKESHWDHSVYSFNTSFEAGNEKQINAIHVDFSKLPVDLGKIRNINKYKLHGTYINKDLIFEY
jgi:hypothetical protein